MEIALLASTIGTAPDPFVENRAARLWEHVVEPLVERGASTETAHIEFADIGAGSGALVAALAERMAYRDASVRLSVSLVENGPTPLSPRFSEDAVRSILDRVGAIQVDYRDEPSPAAAALRRAGLRSLAGHGSGVSALQRGHSENGRRPSGLVARGLQPVGDGLFDLRTAGGFWITVRQ